VINLRKKSFVGYLIHFIGQATERADVELSGVDAMSALRSEPNGPEACFFPERETGPSTGSPRS
jgi:hypothetical protein